MTDRILRTKDVTVQEHLRVVDHDGYRRIWDGPRLCADDSQDAHAAAAAFLLAALPITDKSIAWIGGGLCVGPRLFTAGRCTQTVYEIIPELGEFCPVGVSFVQGDWRETITGKYDIIIYDLGGDVPRDTLAAHLNRGGKILPESEAL